MYIYVMGINRVNTLTTIGMRLLRTVAASGTEVVFPLRFLHDCSHKHECHQSSLNSRSAVHPVPSISWYSMFIIVYPSISKCLSMFKSFISHITLLSPWVFFRHRCDTPKPPHSARSSLRKHGAKQQNCPGPVMSDSHCLTNVTCMFQFTKKSLKLWMWWQILWEIPAWNESQSSLLTTFSDFLHSFAVLDRFGKFEALRSGHVVMSSCARRQTCACPVSLLVIPPA